MERLEIITEGASDSGPCECCGNYSRTVWGFADTRESTVAVYYVHWTLGAVDKDGAPFDVLIGEWGEGSQPKDRVAVALEYRLRENGPAFSVIDAQGRKTAELVGRCLARDEVMGKPIAERAFRVADSVLAQDQRIAELLGGHRVMDPSEAGRPGKRKWWRW